MRIMGEAIKNDKNNNIVRFIPLNVSRKCNDGEDVNNALIDFLLIRNATASN